MRIIRFSIVLVLLSFMFPIHAYPKPSVNDRLVLMWQVQKDVSDDDLKLMKEKGVNLVQAFGITNWGDEKIRNYLDRMNRYNMGVIMSMDKLPKKSGDAWEYDREKASAFVNKWKEHPAVFAWHLFDEPSNKNKEIPMAFQEEVYTFIKSLDPQHPIFLSWNGTAKEHYNFFSERSFDILDLHAYVVDYPGPRQKNLIKMFMGHRTRNYPVIITISAHNALRRPELPPDGVKKQYDFFFRQNNITRNIGFYGWKLRPNVGIKDDPDLMRQFIELEIGR